MKAAFICKEYGWTWEEYINQPADFIETIVTMMRAQATVSKKNDRKNPTNKGRPR